MLSTDRDTVSVTSHGDHRILQVGSKGTVDHSVKLLMDTVVGEHDAPSDVLKSRACIRCYLIL